MTLNSVSSEHLSDLEGLLPPKTIRAVEPRYIEEPRGKFHGHSAAVAVPRTVQEVSKILNYANGASLPVIPFGGGTGLVGGQISPGGPLPLLLSLERMNTIRQMRAAENTATVEAGVILETLHSAANAIERLFPLSLASKGSAQLGGLLATNAGGVNVLRYGNTRDLCLGLEVVLPDGRIWDGLTRLRKDNTGYDLKNLFIGSEGSLGVITAATVKLFSQPASMGTALLVVPSPDDALSLLELARRYFGECVSAFELIKGTGLEFIRETVPDIRIPFAAAPNWSVLIDIGLPRGVDAQDLMMEFFEDAISRSLVIDGTLAQNSAQRDELWKLRENIPEANKRIGAILSSDISLPLENIPNFIDEAHTKILQMDDFRINCFGHVGDGNLHFNVFPLKGNSRVNNQDISRYISSIIEDLVVKLEGSISAEHGIGRLKTEALVRCASNEKMEMLRSIKSTFDPNGIMNPGCILRNS